MADVTDILTHEDVIKRLEQLRDDIIVSISQHGMRASGRTQASMYVQSSGNKIGLYSDRPFFPALETGSSNWTGKTGIKCSYEEFEGIIRQWAKDKGLNVANDDKAISAITWAIIKHGTKTYRQGGRSDIYSPYIVECLMDIGDKLQVLFGEIVTETLLRFTQPI